VPTEATGSGGPPAGGPGRSQTLAEITTPIAKSDAALRSVSGAAMAHYIIALSHRGERPALEYLIKQYPLDTGALEIQYIEEYFWEFPRKKTAHEIMRRLEDREYLILMAEAPLPDDQHGAVVPVSFKIVHEIRANESEQKLADLVARLRDHVEFDGRKILYNWIGGTRNDWRGQGHFRALTEESEAWAHTSGYHEVVVKTKNKFYDMRGTLAQLNFDVVKYEPHASDNRESKVYLSKKLTADVVRAHTSRRNVTYVDQ
jgi:hypothetical protein